MEAPTAQREPTVDEVQEKLARNEPLLLGEMVVADRAALHVPAELIPAEFHEMQERVAALKQTATDRALEKIDRPDVAQLLDEIRTGTERLVRAVSDRVERLEETVYPLREVGGGPVAPVDAAHVEARLVEWANDVADVLHRVLNQSIPRIEDYPKPRPASEPVPDLDPVGEFAGPAEHGQAAAAPGPVGEHSQG